MNNINLNATSSACRRSFRTYVILHELVHTRIKNHWRRSSGNKLDRILPRAKTLRRKLRQYKLGLS